MYAIAELVWSVYPEPHMAGKGMLATANGEFVASVVRVGHLKYNAILDSQDDIGPYDSEESAITAGENWYKNMVIKYLVPTSSPV